VGEFSVSGYQLGKPNKVFKRLLFKHKNRKLIDDLHCRYIQDQKVTKKYIEPIEKRFGYCKMCVYFANEKKLSIYLDLWKASIIGCRYSCEKGRGIPVGKIYKPGAKKRGILRYKGISV